MQDNDRCYTLAAAAGFAVGHSSCKELGHYCNKLSLGAGLVLTHSHQRATAE